MYIRRNRVHIGIPMLIGFVPNYTGFQIYTVIYILIFFNLGLVLPWFYIIIINSEKCSFFKVMKVSAIYDHPRKMVQRHLVQGKELHVFHFCLWINSLDTDSLIFKIIIIFPNSLHSELFQSSFSAVSLHSDFFHSSLIFITEWNNKSSNQQL